jgi:branched-chain amino acid transport system ATP-binding protein
MTTPAVLSLRNVSVTFGGLRAAKDVSFDVRRGELFALIGPNGAGKTTIVNAITGIYRPDAGASIEFTDRSGTTHDLIGRKPHRIVRMGIARTFQNLGLFAHMTVLENLMLGRYVHQRTGIIAGGLRLPSAIRQEAEQRAAVERVIEILGLSSYRREEVGDLPYGLQKRIELARVLVMDPEILLLDEPMAGMTAESRMEIVQLIFEVRAEFGLSILLIEHDMAVVMSIADHVVALNFGEIIGSGTPEDIRGQQAVVDAYLGAE